MRRDLRHVTCTRSSQFDWKVTAAMTASLCPNCGGSMVMLCRNREPAGQREVLLEWVICVACRHVRLDHWSFSDEIDVDDESDDRRQRG